MVLTMHSDDKHLRRALQAGARGYLVEPDAIIRSITAVHDGQVILSQDIGAHLIAATASRADERPFSNLTPREYEVLDRVARGLRNDGIAARLGVSTKTVQNIISPLLLKLGATDRAYAVAIARDAGLGTAP